MPNRILSIDDEESIRLAPSACVVMMTAFASVELAVEAMKLGATDFLRKPTTLEVVRNAVAAETFLTDFIWNDGCAASSFSRTSIVRNSRRWSNRKGGDDKTNFDH